jgi:hypothetical protein
MMLNGGRSPSRAVTQTAVVRQSSAAKTRGRILAVYAGLLYHKRYTRVDNLRNADRDTCFYEYPSKSNADRRVVIVRSIVYVISAADVTRVRRRGRRHAASYAYFFDRTSSSISSRKAADALL